MDVANWWRALTPHVRSGQPANMKCRPGVGLILATLRRWPSFSSNNIELFYYKTWKTKGLFLI